jgi:hypothetical protein
MNSKAQVALEYILIITVSLAIIVTSFVWMQMRTGTARDIAQEKPDMILCDIQDCENDTECKNIPSCGPSATCGPDGTCKPPQI